MTMSAPTARRLMPHSMREARAAAATLLRSPWSRNIVPLAPLEVGVRKVAMVIPISMDIKIPTKASFGAVALKAESGATQNAFTESNPTLSQITLTTWMIGGTHTISWELAQDVPTFNQFCIQDLLLAMAMYEDALFVSGSGSGQPKGLLGNVGAGVSGEQADNNGNLLSIQATFDVLGTLNAMYYPGASWLMSRASGVEIRKAQMQSNLFAPVFVTVNGKDYLHGYPVEYSSSMPPIAAGNTRVLFGDFSLGCVIGDRGGSGINIKVLDQPAAIYGQVILLAYRHVDGKVRRSEAIQGIMLHT
jgi:HK97 family phage major capsid protein